MLREIHRGGGKITSLGKEQRGQPKLRSGFSFGSLLRCDVLSLGQVVVLRRK